MPLSPPSSIAHPQHSTASAGGVADVEQPPTADVQRQQHFLNQLSGRDKQTQTDEPPVAPPRRVRQVKKQGAAASGRAAETSAATVAPAMLALDVSAMQEVRPMKKTRAPEPPSPSSLATAKEPLLPARAAPLRPPPPRLSPARRLARLRQRIAAAMPRPVVHAWQALSGMVRDVFRPLFAGRA